jgi:hypothetical protein
MELDKILYKRWMPSNGKSSVSLWPCELKQNRNGYFKKFLFLKTVAIFEGGWACPT